MNLDRILASPQLPSPPAAAMRILDLSKDPSAEMSDYIEALKTDPALCGKLLKAVNSPLLGFRREIASIERAAPLLGTNSLAALAMSFSLSTEATSDQRLESYYDAYWQQSVIQAVIAESVDSEASRDDKSESFLAGLMLDIGRLAMLHTIPDEFMAVVSQSEESFRELADVEREVLGFDHAEVGAKLLDRWGLPEQLVNIVGSHHPPNYDDAPQLESRQSQVAVFASVAGEYFCCSNKCAALNQINDLGARFFGMDENGVQKYLDETRDRILAACDVFSINKDSIASPTDLLAEASDQLIMLSMQAQQQQQQVEVERAQLEEQNKELREQTIRDALTGVFNRKYFEESLHAELSRSRRSGKPVGVLFMDIDHFKKLNDTYGHQFGDEVLQQVAQEAEAALRDSDTLARYGGEEFVALLPEADEEALGIVGERVRAAIEAICPQFDGKPVTVTASFGGAAAYPEDEVSGPALVGRADEHLYESKDGGRNRVTIASRQLASV